MAEKGDEADHSWRRCVYDQSWLWLLPRRQNWLAHVTAEAAQLNLAHIVIGRGVAAEHRL